MRQHFTQKERDNETGLDYFGARYYSWTQGRFTSSDSYFGRLTNPQTLNLYSYVIGNPLKYNDPSGHLAQDPKYCDEACQKSKAEAERLRKDAEAEGTPVVSTDTNVCISMICGKRIRSTPLNDFAVSGLSGFGLNPIGMVEAGGGAVGGGLFSRMSPLIRRIFGRGAASVEDVAVSQTSRVVVQEALTESGVTLARPVTGQIFERTIETSKGPVDVLAEIVVEGDKLVLKDIAVYGRGKEPLTGVTSEILAARSQLIQEARAMGFRQLQIVGERALTSTSANPGRIINVTINIQ